MARAAAHLQQICRLSPTASASCDLEEERGETSACCQPAPATQQPPAGRAVSGTHNTPPGSSGLPDVSRPAPLPSDLLSLVPSSRPLVAGCSGPTGERDSLAYRAARSETAIAPLSGYPAAAAQPLARVSDDAHAAPAHQCFPQRSLSSPVPGSSLSAAVHPGRHAASSSTVGLDFVNAADFISTGSGSGLGLDGATGPAQDGMTWSSGSAPAEGAPSQLDMVPGQLDMASERIPGASETVLGASAPPPSGHGLARVPSLGQFSPGPLSRSRTQFAPPAFHLPPFPHLEPRAPGARFGTDDSGTGRWGYLRQMHADVDGISEAMGDSKLAIAAAMIRVRSDPGSTGSGSSVHRAGSSLTLADGRSFPPEGASVQCRPTAAAFSRYPDEASRNGMVTGSRSSSDMPSLSWSTMSPKSSASLSSHTGELRPSNTIVSHSASDYTRFEAGIHALGLDLDDLHTAAVLDMLLALPRRDRLQCHYNTLHLEAKILQAVAIVQGASRRGGY